MKSKGPEQTDLEHLEQDAFCFHKGESELHNVFLIQTLKETWNESTDICRDSETIT